MLINYEKLKIYRYRKSPSTNHYCCKCGSELDYCHLEKDVYCVRCEDCNTYTLIEESNWYNALRKVGENE